MRRFVRFIPAAVLAISTLIPAPHCTAEEVAGMPLHVQRLDPHTVRVWLGDFVSTTATVAFATRDGIVVIDTLGIPKVDAALRTVIARELGRNDFKVLINTHEHGDHTGGNSVYADCTIVGHELVAAGMAANGGDQQRMAGWYSRRFGELEAELAKHPADSPEARKSKEQLTHARLNHEFFVAGAKPVVPTLTFSDRMTLAMGDTTFELYSIGGMHSASDIAILVPERGILLTGDTMADTWLTDTPGCLASFGARPGVRHDFPLWLTNWEAILAKKDRITLLLPGHWNGELSLAGAEARVAYVRALWDGVHKAVQAGQSMAEVQAAYGLDTRFAALAESPGFSARNHASTLSEIWKIAANQESAAMKLAALIDEGASEAAIRDVIAERTKNVSKYYFVENEINGHGYGFLGRDQVDKAIAMFRLNVELYPESWNVYDSLGEALLRAGDTAGATAMYEKSLGLNPESASGKDALAKIRGGTASK